MLVYLFSPEAETELVTSLLQRQQLERDKRGTVAVVVAA